MTDCNFSRFLCLLVLASLLPLLGAAGKLVTSLSDDEVDRDRDVEWFNGQTQPAQTAQDPKKHVIQTAKTDPHFRDMTFGDTAELGTRHLRLALKRVVPVGSILTVGNSRVSVLKSGVSGLGDPGDESQWVAAERLDGRQVTTEQPTGDAIVWWVLPPDTRTRAIRLSHDPQPTGKSYAGSVGGLAVYADRYADVAAQARPSASSNAKEAERVIDRETNGWGGWSNGKEGGPNRVSAANPEWVRLDFAEPVTLSALAAFSPGSPSLTVEMLPASDADDGGSAAPDWRPVQRFRDVKDPYPSKFRAAVLDLPRPVEARSVRLLMTDAHDPKQVHQHLERHIAGGKRVWLDELLALMPLGDEPLESAVLEPWESNEAHPPIAVRFHLDEPGNVTLVIDDAGGKRVRNLVSQKPFEAGDNVAWWDGLDDLGRDVDAAEHGLYHVPGSLVEAGTYTVRGLVAPPLEVTYEVSVDRAGTPPWPTPDDRGGWGTNHTPPSCVAVVPSARNKLNQEMIFIGSYVAEGGHGLFWVNLDGEKQGGKHWTGGTWTGAQTLAADAGDNPDTGTAVYIASGFQGETRFVSIDRNLDEAALARYRIAPVVKGLPEEPSFVGDLAAYNRLLVASMPNLDALWFFDAEAKHLLGKLDLDDPNALAFEPDGTLLASSGDTLVRLEIDRKTLGRMGGASDATNLPDVRGVKVTPTPFKLDRPAGIAVLDRGRLAITEQGDLHQVRIYTRDGRLEQAIGKPGEPSVGAYDPNHMNHPDGVAMDGRGRYWVTEAYTQPKRVGLWSASGELLRSWTGPSRYGGGGTLDFHDKTLFYNAGMQFKIDWDTGDATLDRILILDTTSKKIPLEERPQFPPDQNHANALPEQPHYVGGRKFISNWYNAHPVNASETVTVWEDDGEKLVPVAAMGNAYGWWVTESDAFQSRWPGGNGPGRNQHDDAVTFFWQDDNADGIAQPDEMQMQRGKSRGIVVMPDLSFVARIDDRALQYTPTVTSDTLRYDFDSPEVLLDNLQKRKSSGGDVYLPMGDGNIIAYPPPAPLSPYSVGGGPVGGEPTWSYPNMWPGLHASHESPVPTFPGMLIGLTRPMGHPVTPRGGDLGPLWFSNANHGNHFVFTSDGLFVAEIFHDSRTAPYWKMPIAERGMRVGNLTLGEEKFWPSVTQVQDTGEIYITMTPAAASTIVQVHGLDEARRLQPTPLTVDRDQLKACLEWQTRAEAQRVAGMAPKRLAVEAAGRPVQLDGKLDDWEGADWATIDQRGTKAYFNSDSKPYDVAAAMRVAGDKLYIAWRTTEPRLLANSAESETAPFKNGGALDLMLRTDPDATGEEPVAGDQRLFITRRGGDATDGTPLALLYEAVVPGTAPSDRVQFTSPVQTIYLDRVADVSAKVELAQDGGNFEVAVPLSLLSFKPKAGLTIRGDVGVLRGTAGQTTQRVYWSNKATGITSDVPSEAMLRPALWGSLTFE